MKAIMVKYFKIFKIYIKLNFQYKTNLLAKLSYAPARMFMICVLWITIYKFNSQSINLKYIISYYLLALFITQIYPFMRITRGIEEDIYEGALSTYIVRPLAYWVPKLMHFLSWAMIYLLITSPIIIGIILYNKISLITVIGFIVILICGLVIQFLLWFCVGLLSFWVEKILGVLKIFDGIQLFCSGALIPLIFLGGKTKVFIEKLPFKYFLFIPVDTLLSNNYSLYQIASHVLVECIWILILYITYRILWHFGRLNYKNNFN